VDLRAEQPARIRPSAAERERVIRRLRDGREAERLSLETFIDRVDVVYAARSRDELAAVVGDLPEPGSAARAVVAIAGALSRWTALFGYGWRRERLPRLVLPEQGRAVVGRSRACDCVIADSTVSRMHALLRAEDGRHWLSDLGSTNGSWVNGRPVSDEVEVAAGDEILLGQAAFRVVPTPRTMGGPWPRRSARQHRQVLTSSSNSTGES
jgi:FHA domain-containing protein/uncharacterized protein DUF1707